ncbi:adenine phosphoribosyltransferase [Streptomyces sp. NPDC050509]|uniref:adenine phosphoribosyltransferase n=1 Tax=Streptomyces sp. NPDC050509 TaxID=3365620 RepID=UPI0037BC8479
MEDARRTEQLGRRLRELFVWRGEEGFADTSAWWSDAAVLAGVGPALAGLHPDARPTAVMGPEALGFLLGPLVAVEAGTGFIPMRRELRELRESETGDQVLLRTTPPDYNNRTTEWGVRRRNPRPGQRVLFVDDGVDTMATARTARRLVEDSGAAWAGAVAVVDATSGQARRRLGLHALLRREELW